jgi:short subunit fatty acids transporter
LGHWDIEDLLAEGVRNCHTHGLSDLRYQSLKTMTIAAMVLVCTPIALSLSAPADEDTVEMPIVATESKNTVKQSENMTPSQKLENSRVITLILGVFAALMGMMAADIARVVMAVTIGEVWANAI